MRGSFLRIKSMTGLSRKAHFPSRAIWPDFPGQDRMISNDPFQTTAFADILAYSRRYSWWNEKT
jgi:hypothetical protein